LRPLHGREDDARISLGSKRFWAENLRVGIEEVNSQALLIFRSDGHAWSVLTIDV